MSASAQVQVMLDRDVHDRLQQLMAPPLGDVNEVIRALLYHEGHRSPAVIALDAAQRHFTYAEELERASMGIYEGGGAT